MRVAVEGGGCSGFQYIFKFDSIKNSDDLIFKKNDVSVVIDEISLELIKNGTLDYTEELIGSYFQVINPNASSACGYGTSFQFKNVGTTVKIASWNVNSVRARLQNILEWLSYSEIDVLLIQEIKCIEDQFPKLEFRSLGYEVAINGQKIL